MGDSQTSPAPKPEAQRPLSLWAVATLVLGVMSACFLFTPVTLLLGLIALAQCSKRDYRGRKLAIFGMSIAFAMAIGWMVVGMWWHKEVRRRIIEGPVLAIVAGQNDDLDGFREEFVEPGHSASDADIRAFLDAIESRWGRFVVSAAVEGDPEQLDESDAVASETPETGDSKSPVHERQPIGPPPDTELYYLFTFERGTVNATAVFVFKTEDATLINRWSSFVLHDDIQGDLSFPPPPTDNGGG